jgi:hypothetical protein
VRGVRAQAAASSLSLEIAGRRSRGARLSRILTQCAFSRRAGAPGRFPQPLKD